MVGQVIEMRFGHRFDARITGMIAFLCGPIAMLLVQADNLSLAVAAMMIFGMGHGVLTVSFAVYQYVFSGGRLWSGQGVDDHTPGNRTCIRISVGGMLFAMRRACSSA